jgi:hypothetical protein
MEVVARYLNRYEPIDFGSFSTEAAISASISNLPEHLLGAVFMGSREGLGDWDFVALETPLGQVLLGQAQRRDFGATFWCGTALDLNQIKTFCEAVFRTTVRVMDPDTGEIV